MVATKSIWGIYRLEADLALKDFCKTLNISPRGPIHRGVIWIAVNAYRPGDICEMRYESDRNEREREKKRKKRQGESI